MERKKSIQGTAVLSLMTALVFLLTFVIRVPLLYGYINLGDLGVYIAAYLLGPVAALPAAIGSALADFSGGYVQYGAPTFIIKGMMGLVVGVMARKGTLPRYAPSNHCNCQSKQANSAQKSQYRG
jgi:uncharacterized membrane protein